jgi:hypothetical protein
MYPLPASPGVVVAQLLFPLPEHDAAPQSQTALPTEATMTTEDAVKKITAYVIKTGVPAADAVKHLWEEIAPIEDPEALIQSGLAILVSIQYKRPVVEERPGHRGLAVAVRHERGDRKQYRVSVNLLHDLRYQVNGKVKAVVAMNHHDLVTLAHQANQMAQGWVRYQGAFAAAAERLKKFGKQTVGDLGDGEQARLARLFGDARARVGAGAEGKLLEQ